MSPSAAVFYTFLFSRGGSVLNDPQTQAQFNDDVGLKSLQLIAALTKSGAAYLAENVDGALYDFAEGETALWFGTTDDLTAMADAITRANGSFRWDVANVPQNDPGRPLTTLFGSSIAIFTPVLSGVNGTTNERARAAWLFARWLAAPEQSARWARATFTIPVRTSVLQAGDLPAQLQRLRDGFGDTLATGRPLPTVKDAGQIDAATVEMWTSVANGADPAAALKNAATRVNRILGQIP